MRAAALCTFRAWRLLLFWTRGTFMVRGGSRVDAVHVREKGWWNGRVLREQVSGVLHVGVVHIHAIWKSLTLGRGAHL